MKRTNVLHLLLELIVIFGSLVIGVTVLTYIMQNIALDRIFLGAIILSIGIFKITDFVTWKYAVKIKGFQSLVAAILTIAFGAVLMIVKMDSKFMCVLLGTLSISFSIVTSVSAGLNINSQPLLNTTRIIISITEIVFSILLIIRTLDSLKPFVVFIGVALIVEAVTLLIEFMIHRYQV